MFYISYFYNVRFFPQNLVPVSTAMWDPKWYHDFKDQNYVFYDKRNIVNGIRSSTLLPSPEHLNIDMHDPDMCSGRDGCKYDPSNCKFLSSYYNYLCSLDFNEVIGRIEYYIHQRINPNADICLMVYEKYDNPCSERGPLVKWFSDHGIELLEWNNGGLSNV